MTPGAGIFAALMAAADPAAAAVKPERVWDFRGSKDPEITGLMNAHLGRARQSFKEHGQGLAGEFGIPYDASVPEQVQFYDTSDDITAERLRQKRGGVFAYTSPGSRAIRLPGRNLAGMDDDMVSNLIVHELMHSMGLKEDRGQSDKVQSIVNSYMKRKKKERERK